MDRSAVVRAVYLALGSVFLGLGFLGAFLPILPTTPFLLLAAACYARGSTRLYRWLTEHPRFGPMILEWRRSRSLPRRTKWTAIVLMVMTLGISTLVFVSEPLLRVGLVTLGIGLAVFLYRIPDSDPR